MKKGFILMTAALMLISLTAMAGNTEKADKMGKIGETKTFTGILSCPACDLKMDSEAHAQCKVYGHKHALKLENGKYISFLENDHSEDLIKGGDWNGQKIEVSGVYYPDANMIDVDSFKVMGQEFGWCDGHKKMDQCHVGMPKKGM